MREIFLVDGRQIVQMTALNRFDTSVGGDGARGMLVGNRVLFVASANPFDKNPDEIYQFFSVSTVGDDLRQVTQLPSDGARSPQGCIFAGPGCGIFNLSTTADLATGTVLFSSSCDPVGANPFGEQIFAMRPGAPPEMSRASGWWRRRRPKVARKGDHGAHVPSAVVDVASMADLDHDHDVRRLDCVDHQVVADPEPTRPLEAVTQRLAELDGVGPELPLDRRSDLPLRGRGETRDVVADDAVEVLDPVLHSQALP